jgi:hypothetical protein
MKQKRQSSQEKQDKDMNSTAVYGRLHRLLARFFLGLFGVRVHFADREPTSENYLLCCITCLRSIPFCWLPPASDSNPTLWRKRNCSRFRSWPG